MKLTNYPFDRALVAQRQRDRLDDAERVRHTRQHQSGPARPPTTRRSFTNWLRGSSTQSRRAAAA
jgi:hypothetical protein